jgi:hypothetical protein
MMRGVLLLLLATSAGAKKKQQHEVPFDLPKNWTATPAQKTDTAAAPVEDQVWELSPRGQVIVYAGKVSDGELETAAAAKHAARVKNRVAWGMKASGGPPRESLHVGGRRAVRWRDRVGGALGASEQVMTCIVAGARLACVVTFDGGDTDDAAAVILGSLKR